VAERQRDRHRRQHIILGGRRQRIIVGNLIGSVFVQRHQAEAAQVIEQLLATALLPFANRHRGGWLVPQGGVYERLKLHRVWEVWLVCVCLGYPFEWATLAGLIPVALMRVGWGSPLGRAVRGEDDGKLEAYEQLDPTFMRAHPFAALSVCGALWGSRPLLPLALLAPLGATWSYMLWLPLVYAAAIPASAHLQRLWGDIPFQPVEWSGASNEAYMGVVAGLVASLAGWFS
jgi:hypothetical protein